jgi:hypothetical protein
MSEKWLMAWVLAAACTVAACGPSKEEQAAEELQKSADQIQKGAEQMQGSAEDVAKGLEMMAKGLAGAAGGADGDVKPVDPVSFRDLQAVMPEVSGWERQNPTGERMTQPFSFSQASVTFRKGESEIEQKIMDSGFNQLLFTPFAMFMSAGYEKETQDGYERSVNIAGNPGWERWDKSTRNGELNVVVNKRFLVQVEGRDIDDVQALHAVLDQTDLKKLAALQ